MRETGLAPQLPPDGLTVRLAGLGGVGTQVARPLAIYLASLDCDTHLILMDHDDFELRNAARMLFSTSGNKAEVTRTELLTHFAESRLTISAVDAFIGPDNIASLLKSGPGEIILLCVDNHATRKLVSDFCAGRNGWEGLRDVCLISGGNDGVGKDSSGHELRGTFGNCQVLIRRDGRSITPTLTDYHPEIENPADKLPTELDCIESLDHTPQLLFTNLSAAAAICNTFWLYLCGALHYSEVVFDIAEAQMRPLPIPAPTK